jgi:RNA polymerase sigma-70 factor (ECF subfamily)
MSDDVLKHIPALRLFARSLTGRYGDADDLVQDTLVRAISSAASYTRGTNMRAWLFTIMRNHFYNQRVKLARERPGLADCVSGQPTTPDQQQYWHVRGREIEVALMALPRSYREAVMLVLVTGESYQSAAEILEVDIGTIKSRINRGRRQLQEALGEEV